MTMNDATIGAASREMKATSLMNRINAMEEVIQNMCHLRDRIQTGQDNPPAGNVMVEQERPLPSISLVLTDGSEMLSIQYNKMVDILNQIESELF